MNGRLPHEHGSNRRETLGKRVSDDSYVIFYGDFERPLRRRFREVFAQFFRENCPQKNFGNDSFHRRDRFCQIFVQIGAILAIFRPFELFSR